MSTAEMKTITFAGFEIKDLDKGEVAAKIATLEVIDKDGDIIRRGSLPKSSKAVMSRWGHDAMFGERPVGKGSLVEKDGRLEFSGKVFLKTAEGRETFETLKEMDADQEWSFGFRVAGWENPSPEEKKQGAYRIITKMEPVSSSQFEVSPVLAGAGVNTGTTAVKQTDITIGFTDAQRAEIKAMIEEAVAAATAKATEPAHIEVVTTESPSGEALLAETTATDESAIVEAARIEAERKAAEQAAALRELERFQKTMRRVA